MQLYRERKKQSEFSNFFFKLTQCSFQSFNASIIILSLIQIKNLYNRAGKKTKKKNQAFSSFFYLKFAHPRQWLWVFDYWVCDCFKMDIWAKTKKEPCFEEKQSSLSVYKVIQSNIYCMSFVLCFSFLFFFIPPGFQWRISKMK